MKSPQSPQPASPANSKNFTPVILPQSPSAQAQGKNMTGLPRVARDIAADIHNNVQKWNEKHVQGAKLIRSIVNVRAGTDEKYGEEIDTMMAQLFQTVQSLEIYSNALAFLSSQMQAVGKLKKDPAPLFVSLNVHQLAELARGISDAYKAEFHAKKYILENIAHSKTKEELMFFASSWTHQRNITNTVNMKLETILVETGHRKII